MTNSEINIQWLKDLALDVHKSVSSLIGTPKAAIKHNRGAGGDISMEIDVIAEETIIRFIEDSKVNIKLISEEIGIKIFGDPEIVVQSEAKLIIDPIDGSTNASRGIPFSSLSIAYAEGDSIQDIQIALIMDLSTKDLYWASKGEGAYLNDKPISVSENNLNSQMIFEIDFNLWNLRRKLKKYAAIFRKIYRIRVMGSIALSFCLLAKGSIDGYLDFRKGTRLVDMAAGYLLINEAGGDIFTIEGEKLNFPLSMELEMPLVACNSKLSSFLKTELKKIKEN